MRRLVPLLIGLPFVLAGGPAGAFQAASGCAAVFPATVFELRVAAGPVTVVSSDLTVPLAERFATDIAAPASQINEDIGGLDGVEVCLFPDALPLDSVALGWPEGQRLRAASFIDERAVVLSTLQAGMVGPSATLGLVHQAEWAASGGAYPATFGSAVGQWYLSSAAGRLERDHNVLRFARITGAFDEPIPWSAGSLEPVLLWDPQYQISPIGDFVAYAVDTAGPGILADPEPATLESLDAAWRQALLNEARGSEQPTSGWVNGLVVLSASVALVFAIPAFGWWRRRRREARRRADLSAVARSSSP